MARYPGARWRPVARYKQGGSVAVPMARYDGGTDHTYVGSPSPDAAFAHFNVKDTPTPHFMVFRDGSIDQYIDTRFRSSACLEGNPRLVTWETADGFPDLWSNGQAPKDTPEMVAAKARLMVWLHVEHGIPLERMPSSRSAARGMGWHRLGIDGNFEQPPGQLLGGRVAGGEHWSESFGKTCPTSRRIHQFVEETLPLATKLAKPPAQLTVLGWNAHITNTDANVTDALNGWIDEHDPDVIFVSEARTHRDALKQIAGYKLYQQPMAPNIGPVVNDQGDSAILVRDNLVPHVKHHSLAKMRLKWVVARGHKVHTPREYEKVTLKKAGTKFRTKSSHFPTNGFKGNNRPAFLESALRAKAWAKAGLGAVSVDVGDFNENKAAMADWFGKRFKVAGRGIDLAIVHRAAKVEHTLLDKGGSDHYAQLYVITARRGR